MKKLFSIFVLLFLVGTISALSTTNLGNVEVHGWMIVNQSINISHSSINISGNVFSYGTTQPNFFLGNVGIGTSTPQNTFVVSNAGAGGLEVVPDAPAYGSLGVSFISFDRTSSLYKDLIFDTKGTASMVIKNTTGNVGIGTTSPGAKLNINNTADSVSLFIHGENNINNAVAGITTSDYGLYLGTNRTDSSHYLLNILNGQPNSESATGGNSVFYVRSDGNIGIGTTSPAEKLAVQGNLLLGGAGDIANYQFNISSRVVGAGDVDWDISTKNVGAEFKIMTFDASNGNVGIGTTSPTTKLDVNDSIKSFSDSSAYDPSISVYNDANSYLALQMGGTGAGDAWYVHGANSANINTPANVNLSFNIGGVGDRMRILANGNVGIGTTTPASKLEVVGNGNFTGNLTGSTYYAGFYKHNDTGDVINFAVANLSYNFTGICGESNGLYCGADGRINVSFGGLYRVNYVASGVGQNNHLYHAHIAVNGVVMNRTTSHMLASAGDVITMAGIGHLRLAPNDYLNFQIRDSSGTGTGTAYSSNFNIERIAN